jgi:hypothetical protein
MAREISHGTRYTYVRMKCRCDECRAANTRYYQVRRAAQKAAK